MASVSLGIIDPRGHNTGFGIAAEVMVVDLLAVAVPRLVDVFELADQLLLFCIQTDPRVARMAHEGPGLVVVDPANV